MENKFSIIIPMYNAEKYIEKCLNSVINQTYQNIEIIIINDGSTDNSLTLCKNIIKQDSRVKIIDKENGGVSSARNKGLEIATGDYIFFLDSDDWIALNSIEILNKIVEQKNYDLIIYNAKKNIINDMYINEEENLTNTLANLMIDETINAPWGKLYKSSLIKKYNFKFANGINIAEDLLFNIEYYTKITDIYICSYNIYNFNTSNNNSLSRKYNPKKYNQLMFVNDKINALLSKNNNSNIINAQKYIRLKNIISCCVDLFDIRCDYNKNERKAILKKYKKENPKIIIKKLGVIKYFLGIIYTILPSSILYYCFKLINNKLRRKRYK